MKKLVKLQWTLIIECKGNSTPISTSQSHTPDEKFIIMAKEQGIKFTFGSDTRDKKAGRLDYCKMIPKLLSAMLTKNKTSTT